ncbi:MAG: alpha/beta hydrolase [Planctomycetota bacterium]
METWTWVFLLGGLGLAGGGLGCAAGKHTDERLPAGVERVTLTDASGRATLPYLRAGPRDAPRVIFVHGTPGAAANYLAYLAEPPAGVEVVSVDRPGFGQSPRDDPASLTFAGQAAALGPLLVERGGRWPVLVGHSLGGPIVCRAAADRPGRVGGLVVLAGSVDPELERPRWYNVLGAVPPLPWLLPGSLRRANDEVFAAPRQTRELAGVLGGVACPVVVVQGGRDRLVPPGNADYLLDHLPNAASVSVDLIAEAGHFLPWWHEDAVRRAIAEVSAKAWK